MWKQGIILTIFGLAFFVTSIGNSLAQPMAFPAKGQTPEQQEQDQFSCYKWAAKETGVDPMNMQGTAPPKQESVAGGAVRGGAKGAALGAIGGAIGGNAGKGAKIGAAVGGGAGVMGSNRRNRQRQSDAKQEHKAQQADRGQYDRAWGLCMKGKGYEVG
jgi:hypothetical protein